MGNKMAMMDCPRCGFSQPKDRYCANCGLDTQTFQEKPTPPLKKLRRNPYLYIVLSALILFYMGYEIVRETKDLPSKDINNFPEAPITSTTQTLDEGPADRDTSAAYQEAPTAQEVLDAPSANEIVRPTLPNTKEAEPSPQQTDDEQREIEVIFFEVPIDLLEEIIQEGEVLSETLEYKSVLHSNRQELLEILQSGQPLPGSRRAPGQGPSAKTQFTNPRSAASIFSIEAFFGRKNDDGLSIRIQTLLNLEEAAVRLRFSTSAQFTSKNALVLIGLLPHFDNPIYPIGFWEGSPLTVMSNPEFQQRATEFVIVMLIR